MKKIIIFCTAMMLAIVLLSSCEQKKPSQTVERSYVVKIKKHAEQLFFSGELMPIREQAVAVQSDSVVKKLLFHYGSWVKKDQILVELHSPAQQKEYDEAITNFLKVKDELDISQAKFSGTESLWKAGLVPENTYKSDKSSLFTNKISFIQAKAKLVSMAHKISDVSADELLKLSLSDFAGVSKLLDKTKSKIVLKAPYDGIALMPHDSDSKKQIRVGSELKTAEVITLIGDLSGLAFTIKIPEINIDKITSGMKAKITGIAFPNITLDGKVESVNAQANANAGTSGGLPIFTAKVIVPTLTQSQREVLKIGMSASIKVILNEKDIMMIPIAAAFQKNNKTWVNLKAKDGTISARVIRTGYATDDQVLVEHGLAVGDEIIWQEKK